MEYSHVNRLTAMTLVRRSACVYQRLLSNETLAMQWLWCFMEEVLVLKALRKRVSSLKFWFGALRRCSSAANRTKPRLPSTPQEFFNFDEKRGLTTIATPSGPRTRTGQFLQTCLLLRNHKCKSFLCSQINKVKHRILSIPSRISVPHTGQDYKFFFSCPELLTRLSLITLRPFVHWRSYQ